MFNSRPHYCRSGYNVGDTSQETGKNHQKCRIVGTSTVDSDCFTECPYRLCGVLTDVDGEHRHRRTQVGQWAACCMEKRSEEESIRVPYCCSFMTGTRQNMRCTVHRVLALMLAIEQICCT